MVRYIGLGDTLLCVIDAARKRLAMALLGTHVIIVAIK
jgi:hypothetical protein